MAPKIFISAAEPSGDLHGAALIREFLAQHPDAHFVGVAGPKMREQGCQAIADMTARAAMLTGVVSNARAAAAVLARTTHEFSHHHYDAAVVIDSPMLNLPIALRAKSRAIPVLYYIAPQLWAWGAYRAHKVRARVDKLAVILPFEEDYFRNVGLDAAYVGHPLFDHLASRQPDPAQVRAIQAAGQPVIAVLPGSRKHVVREVLPGQLEVAAAVRQRHPDAHIVVSTANPTVAKIIQEGTKARRHGGTKGNCQSSIVSGQSSLASLLSAADLTLVASGTATLEVAYHGCPMIVMYNGSRLMYHLLGRWMITSKYLSLVNILAQRELVPEFMPYYRTTGPIVRTALDLLASADRLDRIRAELAELIAPIASPGASARTARMLSEMIDSGSATADNN
ncbi:MAG: lipid-A-disaccharide synthase [Phycisphaerae bacterium]